MFHFIHHNKNKKLYNSNGLERNKGKTFEKLLALCEKYKKVNKSV